MNNYESYNVPPFDPGKHNPKVKYYWWSWHPNYPYWSKSCWGGETEDIAWDKFVNPECGLSYYHNKLIREYGATFEEVADVPCKRLDIWDKCIEQNKSKHD